MLDWNISTRISNIHRRQLAFEPLNLNAVEMERIRNLVMGIPAGAEVLGALGAAEPETRHTLSAHDVGRYNQRTDIPSVYLTLHPEYLLHLLDGGESGGLVIESEPDDVPFEPGALRSWFMVSYAVLLKACLLERNQDLSRVERTDRFRFWLEHELQISASREAWIGFQLLAGLGDRPDRARRFLKLGRKGDARDAIWGAAWDLMYTRMSAILAQPMFSGTWQLPIVFVTDDSGLVEALGATTTVFSIENANGVTFSGDRIDLAALHHDVHSLVEAYVARQGERVMLRSKGMTTSTLRRAAYLARRLEGDMGNRDSFASPSG